MQTKTCSKCKEEKDAAEFHRRKGASDGLMSSCKQCNKLKTYAWREKNRDRWNEYIKARYQDSERCQIAAFNREWKNSPLYRLQVERAKKKAKQRARRKAGQSTAVKEYRKRYKSRPEVKARRREIASQPQKKKARAKYVKLARLSDPKKIVDGRMSCRLRSAIQSKKAGRKWEDVVGYTLADLISHIESQFSDGMGWHNIGDWHIDHIKPLCSFEYSSDCDPSFRDAWALRNLRPLWAAQNLAKAHEDRKHARQGKARHAASA